MSLTVLYRGSLSSCNYGCEYCPFAKRKESREQLAKDKQELERFINWVSEQPYNISILFTPWGEALIRRYYRDAILKLSHIDHVKKVAIQTNFSCSTQWLQQANRDKVAFWITYHPNEIPLQKFIEKCQQLDSQGIAYSVGIVGLKEHFTDIEMCRKQLDSSTYLWINAYKREKNYYTKHDIQQLVKIDPYFEMNNQHHSSFERACKTGESVISVNGKGDVTRCHFIKKRIANIYESPFSQCLKPRLCSNETCSCYIGYIHLDYLDQKKTYGDGLLERIVQHQS